VAKRNPGQAVDCCAKPSEKQWATQSVLAATATAEAPGQGLRWFVNDTNPVITWSVNFAGLNGVLSQEDAYAGIHRAFALITLHGDLSFREVSVNGNIRVVFKRLDGRLGVLGQAWQPARGEELNVGGVVGRIEIDNEEAWTTDDFANVFLHEAMHAIGLSHAPTGGRTNLMEPTFSFGQPLRTLGAWDSLEIARRYPFGWREEACTDRPSLAFRDNQVIIAETGEVVGTVDSYGAWVSNASIRPLQVANCARIAAIKGATFSEGLAIIADQSNIRTAEERVE
jgi:hypothetical protein